MTSTASPAHTAHPRSAACRLRPMDRRDLDWVVPLHRSALSLGLFPRLGPTFLRAWLAAALDSPYSVGWVASVDGAPAGYVIGTHDPAAQTRWVLHAHGARLAVRGALGLLAHPPALLLFVRTRLGRYARGVWRAVAGDARGASHTATTAQVAVLSHVAVEPHARGAGVGSRLTTAFVDSMRDAGCQEVRLTTRANGPAEAFYDGLGWTRGTTRHTADATAVAEYHRRL